MIPIEGEPPQLVETHSPYDTRGMLRNIFLVSWLSAVSIGYRLYVYQSLSPTGELGAPLVGGCLLQLEVAATGAGISIGLTGMKDVDDKDPDWHHEMEVRSYQYIMDRLAISHICLESYKVEETLGIAMI